MRYTPAYLLDDPAEVKRLIRENPWATIVSSTAAGIVASHYPIMLDESVEGISIVSHVGRPDERAHELGKHEVLVIVQGPHGYISPGWYEGDGFVPTWNHVTAHLWGTPEILDDDENFSVLSELVDHFEKEMPAPVSLDVDEMQARRIATGTVGIRVDVTRFDARLKLSQGKSPEVAARIIDELDHGDAYRNPGLAAEMRRVHE
ncbi:FMN-binding negative transcriptional regulator [Marisediminicola sp. LYQ134]|uniref:FMN-binding negative transcriptional regulator n=1 Tax=unclassified Marisediminicola TaxID=2618316 RepID=UPI0039838587